MREKNPRSLGKKTFLDQVDHSLHRFAFVNGIDDHTFEPRAQTDGILSFRGRYAITWVSVLLEQHHIILDQFHFKIDELRCMLSNTQHLRLGLRGSGRGIDPDDVAMSTVIGKSDDHAGMRRARDRANDDEVKCKPKLFLLIAQLLCEPHVTETAIYG